MTIRTFARAALMMAALLWPMAEGIAAPLRILLTNDDGYDAPGLVALRAKLIAAGHDVTTVAPMEDRSGTSGAMTVRNSLAIRKVAPAIYAVGGTPADCVHAGLGLIMAATPDLVISGTNFGQNAGPGLNISGTFGAARAARDLGIPAIAVSQMFDRANRANTAAYFDDAAEMVVQVIAVMTEGGTSLPSAMLLNLNYPLRHKAELAGWRITRPSPVAGLRFTYEWETDGSSIKVALAPVQTIFEPGTDEAALADGAVSISPLNGEFGIDGELGNWLNDKLAARLTNAPAPVN